MLDLLPQRFFERCKETFADNLQYLVDKAEKKEGKKITLEELGMRLNYSKSVVERWLKGQDIPAHVDALEKIKDALQCTDKEYARLHRAYSCDAIIAALKKKGVL